MVTWISATSGGNHGQITIHVTGASFSPNTTVLLHNGATVRNAASVIFIDGNHLTATFDLTGLAAGTYALEADDGSQSATAPSAFQVTATPAVPNIVIDFALPDKVRVGSAMSGSVTVTNYGNNDVLLPVFKITATNASPPFVTQAPGLLPAGQTPTGAYSSTTFGVTFSPNPSGDHFVHNFNLTTIPSEGVIDWASAQGSSRPPTVPADAWAAIWANFTAALGNSVSGLQAVLQADQNYLAQFGTPVTDTQTLLDFELQKASAVGPIPTLGNAVDVAVPEPGLPLAFSRTFVQSISGRYHLGSPGRGWVSNWDVSTFTDAGTGNVVVQEGALSRVFIPQKDGSYQGTGTDRATLTNSGGHFTLRELDGTVTSFLPDGRLDYVQDKNGNRITAGYTGTLLTTLSHSNGDKLTLAYDAQGRLTGVTDPVGRTVTYGYDAADEHLTGVTTAAGAYAYSYVTGQGGAREHALASATFPDGSHLGLTYDAQGRLTRLDDGSNLVTFAYLSPGGYTITDGSGATTTVLVGITGQPAAVKDALGHVMRIRYDSNGQPVLVTAPDGAAASTIYDSKGNPQAATDPLGNATQATYNPQFNGLQTFQDQLGTTTNFGYNGQGDLQSVTYADGTGVQLTPGAQGLVGQTVNARGQAAHYVYNSRGQVIEADYSDGTTTYTYDAHGNLHTATDAGGTTTLTYDSADRLTRVTYPDGKFLQIGYDANGRRTQTVDQTGFTTNYAYDAAGRLATVKDGSGALIAAYTYDAAGRLSEKDLGNGTCTVYAYDPTGNVLSVVNHGPHPAPGVDGPVNSRFDYTYDKDGQVLTETTLTGTTTYGYDADGQLTSASLPGGRLITYAYDAAGNRTVVSDSGTTTTYVANNLDQYTSAGSSTFTYDADGNLTVGTGPGGSTTYTYDSRDRLIGVATPTDTWTYHYDALGNRTSATHNGQTTQYLVDPTGLGNVIGEYNGAGALVAHYTEGLGLTSRVDASGSASYYDFDALGSTAGLTSAAGNYVDSYSYLPFGEVSNSSSSVPNPFQYVGQAGVMSEGNGLDFMQARFYSPAVGRFIKRDPIGLAGCANLYCYAGNNPVSVIDPSGLIPLDPFLAEGNAYLAAKFAAEAPTLTGGIPAAADPFLAEGNAYLAAKFAAEAPTLTGGILRDSSGRQCWRNRRLGRSRCRNLGLCLL
jgi:RHS repeat-associated protein